MAPQKIMFIRHGEKPERSGVAVGIDQNGNEDKESLTVRGWQRAGAIDSIFFRRQMRLLRCVRSLDQSTCSQPLLIFKEPMTVSDRTRQLSH
jgi:hypothetical protein